MHFGSMFWFVAGIISIILLLVLYSREKYADLPPGPKKKFFIGNLTDLDAGNIHQCLHNLAKNYGPIMHIKLLQRNIVVLSNGDVLRKAFRSPQFRDFLNDKPKGFYGTHLVYNHQDVLLGPYNDVTFKLKSVMYKGLQAAMKDDIIEKETKDLLRQFELTDGKDCHPQNILRTALARALSFVLSGDPKASDPQLMWNFVDTSNSLLNPSVETVLKNFPSLRHCPGKYSKLFRSARNCRDAVIERFLSDYKESFLPGSERGLVDTCLNIQLDDKVGQPWLSDYMIKALILDVIGAGLIASTNTLLGSILTLLHHQHVVTKMREEICHVVGKDRLPTMKDLSDLAYCQAVELELLRYTTVVPLVNHYCSKQNVLFENFTIPKNTMIWGNFWSAHHDDDIFPEPWSFRPERFLDKNGRVVPTDHKTRQSLFPFGLGARVCVGDDFAKTRLFVYITSLVQLFNIRPPVEKELLSCDPTLYSSGAVLQMDNFSCRFIPVDTTV